MPKKVTKAGKAAPKTHAFLAAIRVCPSITRAAKAAGIRRECHSRRLKRDPVYKAAFQEAWDVGIQSLEDQAVEYGQIGYEEPVIWQGQLQFQAVRDKHDKLVLDEKGNPKLIPLTVRKPNPTLHMFMLRGAKPEKYRERHQHKVEVDGLKFAGSMAELLSLYQQVQASE